MLSNQQQPMQIDITNIIEEARAEKELRVKTEKRLDEIEEEIKALEKERHEIRSRNLNNAFYLPKWQSDLLSMVAELIEQPTTNNQ